MNSILILGAGRSASSLIGYILREGKKNVWNVIVGDYHLPAAAEKVAEYGYGTAIQFDINQIEASSRAVAAADVVISLMPAHLHIHVALLCIEFGKHLLNASYVTEEMSALDEPARKKGLLFVNECGLDPGIDHMSAMQVIDNLRNKSAELLSFESFTGGLIAPMTDPTNPWRYKFTWNPRNVVMAGQSTARFLQHGSYRYIPYQQLFRNITPVVVEGVAYEGYANRDSLKYRAAYGLHNIQTMLRGTLRNHGFCSAWNVLVQLGCCDDTYRMDDVEQMTHQDFIRSFVDVQPDNPVDHAIASLFSVDVDGPELRRLRWSGLFDDTPVGLQAGSPAQVLEHILLKQWTLKRGDQDLIVMWHRFVYKQNDQRFEVEAHMSVTGKDETNTAMAQTVGLPLAIAAKLLMQGSIQARGVVIPTIREIYDPVLAELNTLGIRLHESVPKPLAL